ncbi:MAG: FAD-dependent oxidoreductase, partial [Actinobacteria bacterium]|nr:FAD-dependent oxidoreductase [Actinomycetota bacterium]
MAIVAIIGAGMGGMSCAARLAAKGHSVTVYEASDTWGGKLGEQTYGAHRFDTGPSLLTLPAVYRDIFLKTGGPLEDSVEIVELERAFRYQFADGSVLNLPGVGIGACASAIGDTFGGSSADEWRKFMQRAAQMWAVTRKPFLESPLNGLRSLAALSWRLSDMATIAPTKTLRSLAQHYFTDPRLVTLVDRYATYSGSDPRKAPAALATIPYIEQTFGAYHVSGG